MCVCVCVCVCVYVCESLEAVKISLSVESNKAQQWSETALSNFNGVLFFETPYFTTCRPTIFRKYYNAGIGVTLL